MRHSGTLSVLALPLTVMLVIVRVGSPGWVLVGFALLCACAGMRSTPATRYQGMLLNGRDLGADELRRESATDPTLAAYVAQHGTPDFLLVGSPRDVQLVYARRSVLAYFRRSAPASASVVREVTPLPTALLQMLPSDLRAGTPPPMTVVGPSCWMVELADGSCRTCCVGRSACNLQCTPPPAR